MARTLKVSVTIKLDIDAESWALEYGFDAKDPNRNATRYGRKYAVTRTGDNPLWPWAVRLA